MGLLLYLDTSALVKLFVPETHSETIRAATKDSVIATHLLAYTESRSAFARLAEARKDKSLFQRLRNKFDVHWAEWEIVQVEETLVRRAGEFCARYRLRGYDSIHLAAAEKIHQLGRGHADFRFGVFDIDLARAAKMLGLPLLMDI